MIPPVPDEGGTEYGSRPANGARTASASRIVCWTGVASDPFATFSFAAMSWRARMMLASPLDGARRTWRSSDFAYVSPPRVRESTDHFSGWVFQNPWESGHGFRWGAAQSKRSKDTSS